MLLYDITKMKNGRHINTEKCTATSHAEHASNIIHTDQIALATLEDDYYPRRTRNLVTVIVTQTPLIASSRIYDGQRFLLEIHIRLKMSV